jgi:HEAT repeat protein
VQALDDDVGAVRYAAAEALGKIGDTAAVPHLLQRLNQKDFGALGPLIESLANLKSVQAIPHFILFLRDHDPRVRGLAANALMVMTRQFIAFKAKGTLQEREVAVLEWETWWAKNKNSFKLP